MLLLPLLPLRKRMSMMMSMMMKMAVQQWHCVRLVHHNKNKNNNNSSCCFRLHATFFFGVCPQGRQPAYMHA
jgi:hypothetical protein